MADGEFLTDFVSLTSLFRDTNQADRVWLMPQRFSSAPKECREKMALGYFRPPLPDLAEFVPDVLTLRA